MTPCLTLLLYIVSGKFIRSSSSYLETAKYIGIKVGRWCDRSQSDGLGIAGVADTALALSKGQVRMLLMRRDFAGDGGECPNCGTLRAGRRDKCPYDGAELRPVELREAFVARAIQQSADIEIVEAGDYLAQHEGVGALLRYREAERTA